MYEEEGSASPWEKLAPFGPILTRVALALVFLWFGVNQITNSSGWVSFLPEFISAVPISPVFIIFLNGLLEVILGTFLFFGIYIRMSAFLLGTHLLGISLSVGFNSVGVRDFGLAFATLGVAAYGSDSFSLDGFLEDRKILSRSLFTNVFYYAVLLGVAAVISVYAFSVFRGSDSFREMNLSGNTPQISTSTQSNEAKLLPVGASGTVLTASIVAEHNVQSDCWLIIENKVYSATQYISFHPGGEKQISSRCGTDASVAFATKGGSGSTHSANAKKLLTQYYVGTIGQKFSSGASASPSVRGDSE